MLNREGADRVANSFHQFFAGVALGAVDFYLDQLVRLQGAVNLAHDRRRQTVTGNADDGIQMVGARTQFAPPGGGKLAHSFLKSFRGMDSTPMKRTKTSKAWMQEHVNDPYVQRAKTEGYRSRAAFKLMEIDDRDRLLRPGMIVVDLGAAPGSWSQVALRRVGTAGRVFALDLLAFEPLPGVEFVQGDFQDEAVLEEFESRLGDLRVDVVLSDMAPNMSGIDTVDQARSIYLGELALDFATRHLKPGGAFLVKVFQGEGFMQYRGEIQKHFNSLQVRKPKASRDRSAEVYLLGSGKRGS